MTSEPIIFVAVIMVTLTSVFVLITRDWKLIVFGLGIQYIGVFLLVSTSWLIEMAAAKLVAGWMACAILGIAMTYVPDSWPEAEKSIIFGPIFRILAVIILALAVTSLVLHSESWLFMISIPIQWGSFALISIGLMQLSLTSHPLRVIIGLLTVLSGFEILYAVVESSTLVTGLLTVVTLGLALVGAYLLVAPTMEQNQ